MRASSTPSGALPAGEAGGHKVQSRWARSASPCACWWARIHSFLRWEVGVFVPKFDAPVFWSGCGEPSRTHRDSMALGDASDHHRRYPFQWAPDGDGRSLKGELQRLNEFSAPSSGGSRRRETLRLGERTRRQTEAPTPTVGFVPQKLCPARRGSDRRRCILAPCRPY